ncbi:STM2901 family protein [Caballeronia sp. LZ043]|uniref:STM2901 family protein n=1 Tax=Caballeronia sp. LZ043 TaxID=3038569 RepID=UPI0038573A77
MSNLYQYGIHDKLSPSELFFLIVLDETCKQTGVDVSLVSRRTSVASMVSRSLLPVEIKYRILPTITSFSSVFALRIKFTRNLGAFVGRAIPGVGWVLLANDVSSIMWRASLVYNSTVKPEDRW